MKNTSKVFREEINVIDSNKFLTVREAAMGLKVNQIKHLISQGLIFHKLENGTSVVDVNSIDESVMIDLRKGENVYPIGKIYKLKSNKTIDKKIVIDSVIDSVENSKDQYFVEYKQFFNSLRGNYANDYDVSTVQLWVHDVTNYYHNYKDLLYYDYKEYTIVSLKKQGSEYEKYFYFLPSEDFLKKANKVSDIFNILKHFNNVADEDYKNFFNKELSKYIYENHLFYLTLDEFIKEFSPPEYYEKNKIWSLYLDKTAYVAEEASNDEDISRSPMKHHKVRGFWRNQPYGSKEDRKSKMTWIDPFERGGKKVKMAA